MDGHYYVVGSTLTILVDAPTSENAVLKESSPGAILRVDGEARPSGLVDATTSSGETVTLFCAELGDRAHRVNSANAG